MPAAPSLGFASAPRGPRRGAGDGAGARSAAERFGLAGARPARAVLAVAAEASARVPEEWEIEGPGIALSLGDAVRSGPGPACGDARPGRPGRGGARARGSGRTPPPTPCGPARSWPPSTEQAVAGAATLTDDQLAGAMRAARRQKARAAWQETTLVGRVRPPSRRPARRRQGQRGPEGAAGRASSPTTSSPSELLITRNQAAGRIEGRPRAHRPVCRTYAGMADGTISPDRADTIAAADRLLVRPGRRHGR